MITYSLAELNIRAAPLISPIFTGTPTAPTAAVGANTTQIATTAFVMNNSKASIADDTSTNTDFYPAMSATTTGRLTTATISSTKLYFNPSTGVLSATNFNTLSDKKYKTNIKVIPNALEKINMINGVTFNWLDNNLPSAGIIAQELEVIAPELVSTSEEGKKTVNYNGIIGYLVNSIKELTSEIESLKKQ